MAFVTHIVELIEDVCARARAAVVTMLSGDVLLDAAVCPVACLLQPVDLHREGVEVVVAPLNLVGVSLDGLHAQRREVV